MENNSPKKILKAENIFLATLVLIFLFTTLWFVENIRTAYKSGQVTTNLPKFHRRTKIRISPEQIETWMTFRYINYNFNLEENFLKQALKITDNKYPNLTLLSYAKKNKLNSQEFILKLKTLLVQKIHEEVK